MLQEWAWVYFKTISPLPLLNVFILHRGHLNLNNDQQKSHLKSVNWVKKYPQFSLPTISWHATKNIELHPKETKAKGGHKPKLSKRDEG